MDQRKRIAIYGGTFDPVHSGHLQIARSVTEIFALDQFWFMPALVAPHKADRTVSSALHRYAMLALATQHDERLLVSSYELEGRERQYTVDTLEHLVAKLGDETDLFFVMGLDSWTEITSWREWKRLPTLANLIVVTRPGFEFSMDQVGDDVAAMVVDVRGRADEIVARLEANRNQIFITDVVRLDIAATTIREQATENKDLAELVPQKVGEYIRKYGLYRN